MLILAVNAGLIPRPWRLVLVGVASLLATLIVDLGLGTLVRHPATYIVSASWLAVVLHGLVLSSLQLSVLAALTAGLLLLMAISSRRSSGTRPSPLHPLTTATSAALGVFLLVSPVPLLIPALRSTSPPNPEPVPFVGTTLDEKPDIILFVFDGYPGRKSMATVLGLPDQLSGPLVERGFQVNESSWSSYSLTHLAVPSLLEMSYPVTSGIAPTGKDLRRLSEINGGDNAVASFLQVNDYRVTMLESTWHGSNCAPMVDECLDKPMVDDGFHGVLSTSILYPFINRRYGDTFTAGTLEAFSTASTALESIGKNSQPDFVYMHFILPHPPVTFDADCNLTSKGEQRPGFLGLPGLAGSDLRKVVLEYGDQLSCTNSFILSLVDRAPGAAHVLLLSDHGTDSLGQLFIHPEEWNHRMIVERFNNYLAYRPGSDSCRLEDPVILPNIFRQILGCLTGESLPPLPDRMFVVVPDWAEGGTVLHEVTSPVVDELLQAQENRIQTP